MKLFKYSFEYLISGALLAASIAFYLFLPAAVIVALAVVIFRVIPPLASLGSDRSPKAKRSLVKAAIHFALIIAFLLAAFLVNESKRTAAGQIIQRIEIYSSEKGGMPSSSVGEGIIDELRSQNKLPDARYDYAEHNGVGRITFYGCFLMDICYYDFSAKKWSCIDRW